MTKAEIIKTVAGGEGITQASARRIVEHTLELITAGLRVDGRVEVAGFGVFKTFQSAAVSRPNPQDRSKIIHTPTRKTVKFKPSLALKAAVQ